jgi:hypothetical protein
MRFSSSLLLTAATLTSAQVDFERSTKRGLVFVPSTKYPSDNQIWVEGNSDLSWYYNYGVQPSPAYSNRSQEEFEFVPMLWSPSTTFLSSVTSLINGGRNITHVLTYNEPDGSSSTGGSDVDPATAATNWISQVEPLRKLGVKLGAPAVTGAPGGATWLKSFFADCASQGTNCTVDFMCVHWYGSFDGLASHLGEIAADYPGVPVWVTEYALDNDTLTNTQSFFNQTAEYFDSLNQTTRYSYFGAFRSDVSNVGPNAAMLTQNGKLTDIGSWYLGGAATNNIPSLTGAAPREIVNFGIVAALAAFAGFLVL